MYTTKMKPEVTIKLYANFFNICGVKSFENVSDEKIEILKQKATELKNQFIVMIFQNICKCYFITLEMKSKILIKLKK